MTSIFHGGMTRVGRRENTFLKVLLLFLLSVLLALLSGCPPPMEPTGPPPGMNVIHPQGGPRDAIKISLPKAPPKAEVERKPRTERELLEEILRNEEEQTRILQQMHIHGHGGQFRCTCPKCSPRF